MSLLEKLKAGTRNIRVLKFPGTDEDVAVRVLSAQEIQDSVFAAETLFKKAEVDVSASTLDAYEDERTTQILWRALRDPENQKEPFAATVAELRKGLTRAEKSILADLYNEFEKECSPDFMAMTDTEFEELFETVKKNPEQLTSNLSSPMLRGLLRYLASRPSTLPTGSGST